MKRKTRAWKIMSERMMGLNKAERCLAKWRQREREKREKRERERGERKRREKEEREGEGSEEARDGIEEKGGQATDAKKRTGQAVSRDRS